MCEGTEFVPDQLLIDSTSVRNASSTHSWSPVKPVLQVREASETDFTYQQVRVCPK